MTPGPWEVYDRIHIGSSDPKHGHVATVEMEEDASLIAAAPDLYMVAKEALAYVEAMPLAGQLYQRLTLPDLIRAAIAKAEGRGAADNRPTLGQTDEA